MLLPSNQGIQGDEGIPGTPGPKGVPVSMIRRTSPGEWLRSDIGEW